MGPDGAIDPDIQQGGEKPDDLASEYQWNKSSLTVSFTLNGNDHTTYVIDYVAPDLGGEDGAGGPPALLNVYKGSDGNDSNTDPVWSVATSDGEQLDGETFPGSDAAEVVFAEGGNDTVDAGGGDDKIDAGAGADEIKAGDGDDLVYGGEGNDLLQGGGGSDQLFGDAGNDTLDGGRGDDFLNGGDGANDYVLSEGTDVIASFVGGRDSFELPDGAIDPDIQQGGDRPDDLASEYRWNESSLTVSFTLNGNDHTTYVID